jgi:uncharacterized protein (DUF362 family)
MDRRDFLKSAFIAGAGISFAPSLLKATSSIPVELTVVKGDDPAKITKKAVEMLGGMQKFIGKGETVIVKPNIGWDRVPELAANTNPFVVKAIVEMALDAGAKTVKVMDNPCNDARRCYLRSGIKDAAEQAGASVEYMDERRYRDVAVGGGVLKKWPVYIDFLEADKIINVPILKHHGLSQVTIGMKNWFGAVGGRRNLLHQDIHQSMVDMNNFFKPVLTVVDAYRVRVQNGPQGTNPADVRLEKTIIASANSLYADAYSATLLGHKPMDLPFLRISSGGNQSKLDISKYNIASATA